VVVCDREGASDIAAPGLEDYPHMRPAIFPLSVDLFTSSKHNMVARVVSLPGLPELFHHCLSTIASQLGLFVGHTGAMDQPSSSLQQNINDNNTCPSSSCQASHSRS
jgi:hypothetical protein